MTTSSMTQAEFAAWSEALRCCADVCVYCGGRAPQWNTEPKGPNDASNFVHHGRESTGAARGVVLCVATGIRIRWWALAQRSGIRAFRLEKP